MRKITKLFTTKAQSINDETKTIRFKISDNQTDRMGEIVDQESWDFKNYMNNPVVLVTTPTNLRTSSDNSRSKHSAARHTQRCSLTMTSTQGWPGLEADT